MLQVTMIDGSENEGASAEDYTLEAVWFTNAPWAIMASCLAVLGIVP
jgi:hypothetical protein